MKRVDKDIKMWYNKTIEKGENKTMGIWLPIITNFTIFLKNIYYLEKF